MKIRELLGQSEGNRFNHWTKDKVVKTTADFYVEQKCWPGSKHAALRLKQTLTPDEVKLKRWMTEVPKRHTTERLRHVLGLCESI